MDVALTVLFPLQDWQAVVVWADALDKQSIAIQEHVLWCDCGRNVRWGLRNKVDSILRVYATTVDQPLGHPGTR